MKNEALINTPKKNLQLENRPYPPTSSLEEIELIKSRVTIFDEKIIWVREIPYRTPFTINLLFEQVELLSSKLENFGMLLDLRETLNSDAFLRRTVNAKFEKLDHKISHIGFIVNHKLAHNSVRFAMHNSNLKSYSIDYTIEAAVKKIKNRIIDKVNYAEKDSFLGSVFENILDISKGKCKLNFPKILSTSSEIEQKIMQGLLFLYEDMELYKQEVRSAMEAEYKVKILEQKNKQLEQFNYIASHDLQEPLRTISSFTGILNDRYKDKMDEKGQKYLGFVVQSSERMSALIHGLLNYSRLGRDSEKQEVDCQEIIDAIFVDLKARIEETHAEIEVENLPKLIGYELELRQLFQNLISNALKFNRKEIPINIKISCQAGIDEFVFRVKDNGIGIKEEHQERIFGIFQRLHNKQEFEGTGIGLSNCMKIIEMHNGKIWVESVYGEGSSFYFTIPYLEKLTQ